MSLICLVSPNLARCEALVLDGCMRTVGYSNRRTCGRLKRMSDMLRDPTHPTGRAVSGFDLEPALSKNGIVPTRQRCGVRLATSSVVRLGGAAFTLVSIRKARRAESLAQSSIIWTDIRSVTDACLASSDASWRGRRLARG